MLNTIRKAIAKLHKILRADFDPDENFRLALARLIQIIGEAALPPPAPGHAGYAPEERAQIDATPTLLCRLGCLGRADVWAFGCATQVYLQD